MLIVSELIGKFDFDKMRIDMGRVNELRERDEQTFIWIKKPAAEPAFSGGVSISADVQTMIITTSFGHNWICTKDRPTESSKSSGIFDFGTE